MLIKMRFLGIVFVFLLACSSLMAQDVIGWRTDTTGRFLDADPPTEWSAEKNVIWKTKMPNWTNSSPLIVGDRIFTNAEPSLLVCVDANNGEILWWRSNTYFDMLRPEEADKVHQQLESMGFEGMVKEFRSAKKKLDKANNDLKKLGENPEPEKKSTLEKQIEELNNQVKELDAKLKPVELYVLPLTRDVNGYSSSTPASDGKNVYVVYGTGVVACYDIDGNRKWIRFLEKSTHEWGHSASPVIVGDKLIVHIQNLVALNKDTGEIIWKSEAMPRWGTEEQINIAGVDIIITPNGDFFRASDGKLLAKDTSFLEYARPIIHEGIIYFIQNEGKAFKLPTEVGDELKLEFLWQTMPRKDRYYSSSVLHDGLIYAIVREGHFFSVIDAKTGEVIREDKLVLGKGTTYPSITLAGKYLFVSNDNGTTVIMEPGREPKEIFRNSLETFRGSPVFVGDRIYIRGMENMYCIGKVES